MLKLTLTSQQSPACTFFSPGWGKQEASSSAARTAAHTSSTSTTDIEAIVQLIVCCSSVSWCYIPRPRSRRIVSWQQSSRALWSQMIVLFWRWTHLPLALVGLHVHIVCGWVQRIFCGRVLFVHGWWYELCIVMLVRRCRNNNFIARKLVLYW